MASKKVLIVDDEDNIGRSLQMILEREGYAVTICRSLAEFRAKHEAARVDAYLFDIDGTLLLSKDRTHRYALHRAMLDVYGIETTIDGIAYHGKTDVGIWRAALERAGIATNVINQRM